MALIVAVAALTACLLLVPIAVLGVECLGAAFARSTQESEGSPVRTAILIPAHNEALVIETTLTALLPQLTERDRLLVIADNCTDTTAAIVRSFGVTTLERHNQEQRGKGYALDYGLQQLAADPPEVVVIIDADCLVQPGAIAQLTHLARTHQRPVQATYLMLPPEQSRPRDGISAFAFRVKNLVRPLGLAQLGCPCLLMGTGMAFPWVVLQSVSLASGNIVEDMQLGLDLAIAGFPPRFCPEALVLGQLPQQGIAAQGQRTRWEHGHLRTLLTQVPRLLQAAVAQRRWDLGAIALDLAVPPLALLVLLWLGTLGLALVALPSSAWPLGLVVGEGGVLLGAIALAWSRFGRQDLRLTTLLAVPLYIAWKIPLYLAFLLRPQTRWIRTQRDPKSSDPN